MSSKHDVLTAVLPQVEKASRGVAGQWPGVVDAGDLVQEISLKVLTEFSSDAVSRLESSSVGEQRALFRMMATQIASEYRSAYETFTGNYKYDSDEVRNLLNSGCLVFADLLTVTERIDITNGMEKVSEHYREVLVSRFIEEAEDVDTKEVSRAVRALTEQMNRSHKTQRADYYTGRPRKGPADVEHL